MQEKSKAPNDVGAQSAVAAPAGRYGQDLHRSTGTLARRVTIGPARTGTMGSRFSGDLFLAFCTASPGGSTPGVSTFRPAPATGFRWA